MTPTERKKLFEEVKEKLLLKLSENDFSFDLGVSEQAFPERDTMIDLDNGLIAEVSFVSDGRIHHGKGDHYTPSYDEVEINASITHIVVWNDMGNEIYEYRAIYNDRENTITIKY